MSSEPLVRMPKDLIEEYWKGNAKKTKKAVSFFEKDCEEEPWQNTSTVYNV